MVNITNKHNKDIEAELIISLLKEYKIEIVKMRNEYIAICNNLSCDKSNFLSNKRDSDNKLDFNLIKKQKKYFYDYFNKFDMSIKELLRSASQYLDQSNMEFLYKLELQIRLADFEKELYYARSLICDNDSWI